MKVRSLLLLAGVAGIAYLVWRMTQGSSVVAQTGGIGAVRVNDLTVLPVRRQTFIDPGSPPNYGAYDPGVGELGPPVDPPSYWQGDLVTDAHIASGLPVTSYEDPGTNQQIGGVTSPFMKRPLEWINPA